MFEQGRKVWWPVKWQAYNEQGEVVDRQCLVRYQLLTRAERAEQLNDSQAKLIGAAGRRLRELQMGMLDGKEVSAAEIDARVREQMSQIEQLETEKIAWLKTRIDGWRDFVGEDGAPVEFTAENLNTILSYADFARLFAAGFEAASNGAIAKN